ncbi:hypothetical protein [Maritimibacter fusiformis]|uniref:Transferrin-binding protein B C-lobe/N-lobe beta barrel domain-containing protein n=1 Tax=Maritimibacter fusiformis TaxID=2603819 RepID=A0A5D0RP67_9RHOB|nr:hypothetical protein [Maritimibacter fusiformis]TYB82786.1 hypothetical protein FVF75_00955 [Maritimibacter fusiformis]
MRMTTMVAFLAGASGLAGCAQISLMTKAVEYMDISGELDDAEGVAVDMPEGGTADYDGVVGIGARYRDGGVMMLGDAALTADFDAATIDGRLDDFIVAELDGDVDIDEFLGNPIGAAFSFRTADGEIGVTGGSIAGTGFLADFEGTVTTDDNAYYAKGELYGDFLGANGQLIEARADAADMLLRRNGSGAEDVELYLAAEAD